MINTNLVSSEGIEEEEELAMDAEDNKHVRLCLQHGEIANSVCLFQSCTKYLQIMCIGCISEHPEHSVRYFRSYKATTQNLLKSARDAQKTAQNEPFLRRLDDSHAAVHHTAKCIKLLKEDIDQISEGLQQKTQAYVDEMRRKIDIEKVERHVEGLLATGGGEDCAKMQEKLRQISQFIKVDDPRQPKIDLSREYERHLKSLQQFNLRMEKLQGRAKKILDNMFLNTSCEISVINDMTLRFSQSLKAPPIALTENQAVATQTKSTSSDQHRFVLAEQPLSRTEISRWGVEIRRWKFAIGVGVCLRQVMQDKHYNFERQGYGNGYYLINQTYSYSHTDSNPHYKNVEFPDYGQGDSIFVEYNPKTSQLSFRKNHLLHFYSMRVEYPMLDELYACVALADKDEAAKLVPWEVEEEDPEQESEEEDDNEGEDEGGSG